MSAALEVYRQIFGEARPWEIPKTEFKVGQHVYTPEGLIDPNDPDGYMSHADGAHGIVLEVDKDQDGNELVFVVAWSEGRNAWVQADGLKRTSGEIEPTTLCLWAQMFASRWLKEED